MDRMLVIVFDTEAKAYEGKEALRHLENRGSVVIYSYAVVGRKADGTIVFRDEDMGPIGTLFGTSFGALVGALAGPAGLVIGAAAGVAAGGAVDLHNAGITDDFIDDVIKELLPDRFAVVAEVQEEWTAPVDERMEALGGVVFRRGLSDVKHAIHDENVAAMKADLAGLKAEHARAHAGRKAKLQEKINQLESKLETRLEKAKERRKAAQQRAEAKAAVLEAQAAKLKEQAANTRM